MASTKSCPSTDPRSTIHQTNLVETCGKCHPGATDNFAQSKVHVDWPPPSSRRRLGDQINWWVRRIYLVLIVGTIGFMLAPQPAAVRQEGRRPLPRRRT